MLGHYFSSPMTHPPDSSRSHSSGSRSLTLHSQTPPSALSLGQVRARTRAESSVRRTKPISPEPTLTSSRRGSGFSERTSLRSESVTTTFHRRSSRREGSLCGVKGNGQ